MDFEKVAEAIKKASPEIRRLMFSADLASNANEIATENNLEEETALRMIDEIGYVILGLKNRFDFVKSLASLDIERERAEKISKEVELKIFSELDKATAKEPKKEEFPLAKTQPLPPTEETKPAIKIGDSFTQAIINQAKAMRPIAQGARSMNYELGSKEENKVPENLPTENKSVEEKPATTPTTPAPTNNPNAYSDKDPYREPV